MNGATKNPAEQLGLNIRLARVKAGYSQETLSELSGMSMTYIGIVERGLKNITILNCQKLAEALNTSICELLDGVFEPKAKSTRQCVQEEADK
ncbi:MAG: helix-turn-helix transcriptional regulator [Chlorobiaceae bacterium]|nr:helix-turn-helix transcriptional regulator [Chlorobiaceae bacterium]